jgi:hypothetical protein
MKEGLRKSISLQKYVSPTTLLDWIRDPWKSIKNVSNHWKAMVLAFLVIGNSLTLKVGNGKNVRIGSDPIMGCGEYVFITPNLINHLHEKGIFNLHQIVDTDATNVWQEGLKLENPIELGGEWMDSW